MSVVSLHQVNHNLNWNNIQILDSELFFQKRLISEMIFKKTYVSKQDTDQLLDIYVPTLNIMSSTHHNNYSLSKNVCIKTRNS